jgi:hypothetical protein
MPEVSDLTAMRLLESDKVKGFLILCLLNSPRALPSGYATGYLQRCYQWVVYRDVTSGLYTEMLPVGCLQRCYQWVVYRDVTSGLFTEMFTVDHILPSFLRV